MDESRVSEETRIVLSISSWYHVMVILGVIVAMYFSLRADVAEAIAMGAQNAITIKDSQKAIYDLQIESTRNRTVLDRLDRTMDRYVRDPNDPDRKSNK